MTQSLSRCEFAFFFASHSFCLLCKFKIDANKCNEWWQPRLASVDAPVMSRGLLTRKTSSCTRCNKQTHKQHTVAFFLSIATVIAIWSSFSTAGAPQNFAPMFMQLLTVNGLQHCPRHLQEAAQFLCFALQQQVLAEHVPSHKHALLTKKRKIPAHKKN